jgi:hypothetical protein
MSQSQRSKQKEEDKKKKKKKKKPSVSRYLSHVRIAAERAPPDKQPHPHPPRQRDRLISHAREHEPRATGRGTAAGGRGAVGAPCGGHRKHRYRIVPNVGTHRCGIPGRRKVTVGHANGVVAQPGLHSVGVGNGVGGGEDGARGDRRADRGVAVILRKKNFKKLKKEKNTRGSVFPLFVINNNNNDDDDDDDEGDE